MKVACDTLGCKVNQYETDLMMKNFLDNGYEIVDFSEKADVYVVNSCSVTNLSTRKTRQALSKAKRQGGIVVLVGCYAQEIKEQKETLENVDIILGNEEKKDIVTWIESYIKQHPSKKTMYQIGEIGQVKKFVQKDFLKEGMQIRESIKIEDGCNNFCSYCIIPYVRGRVRSRNLEQILREANALVKSGVGELVLVGIEIASYGKDLQEDISVIDVIEAINKIPGLKRIRLGSLEPRVLTEENVKRLAKVDKLCPHFHLSVQSLDNDVLKRMNRHYTREDVFKCTALIKKYISNVAFTCDVIVGFPGETEEEFKNTLNGVKEIGFYEVHVFKYSKRKWTRAATMKEQVAGEIKNKRSEELIVLAKQLKNMYLETYIQQSLPVLFESYQEGYLYGYTPNYIKVKVRGDRKQWGHQLIVELNSIENDYVFGSLSQ